MKITSVLILVSIVIWSASLHAESISPFTYLRKLSFHIRGKSPTDTEYEILGKIIAKKLDVPAFFEKKINEYLSSKEHVNKMDARLSELFSLKASPYINIEEAYPSDENKENQYQYFNSLNALFRSLAEENLSWDSLLTGKKYSTYGPGSVFDLHEQNSYYKNDFGFFGAIAPEEIPPVSNGVIRMDFSKHDTMILKKTLRKDITFSEHDLRVAGSLTTQRFLTRYVNTAVNKNRRRAAAIFRIFLCDDMKANITKKDGSTNNIFELSFPEISKVSKSKGFSSSEKIHGNNISCQRCHLKLDPLGSGFNNNGNVLSNIPSPGSLVFKKRNGQIATHPFRGLGEMALNLAKTEEFNYCQIKHFWNWFIGEDVNLSDSRAMELNRRFVQLDKRTNDFISYLVKLPEFQTKDSSSQKRTLSNKVKKILRNCNSCHDSTWGNLPDFGEWPIGSTDKKMEYWLSRIRERIDLKNDGINASMPPWWGGWKLTKDELKTLKKWYSLHHPHQGKPQSIPMGN